jgi:outer membrane lipopolysaccharide assembly protein LptE/RlpB
MPTGRFSPLHPARRLVLGVLGLLLCGGLLAGCGYRLQGEAASPRIHRLHVAAFSNGTFKAGVDGLVGSAVLRQLRLDGRMRLTDEAAADAVLAGRVTTYENEAVAVDQNDIGRRFRVRVVLQLSLTDRRAPAEGFKTQIDGEAFYTTGVGVADTRAAEEEATVRAARDLAERILTRLVEDF